MNPAICDTNIFISLFKGLPKTIQALEGIGNENILVPSITIMELFRGMENKKELATMSKKISQYNVIHFNENVVYGLPLLTYNVKDFKFIPKINLYVP